MAVHSRNIRRQVAFSVLVAAVGSFVVQPWSPPRVTAAAQASGAPDFSGVWRYLEGTYEARQKLPGFSLHPMWVTLRTPVTITQNRELLTIGYVSDARSHQRVQLTYRLDGSETMNSSGASVSPQDRPSRAEWQGESLVLISFADLPDRASGGKLRNEFRDVLTLESPRMMRVESSRAANGMAVTMLARLQRAETPAGRAAGPTER